MLRRMKTSDVMKFCALNMDMDSQLYSAIQFTFHLDVMCGCDGGPHDNQRDVLILLTDTALMNCPVKLNLLNIQRAGEHTYTDPGCYGWMWIFQID